MAIRGLSREDLIAQPLGDPELGKWTIQQVVLHLADSEQIIADRMKAIIAEDNPTLVNVDESAWAQKLSYHEQSIEDAIELMTLIRRQMAIVLRAQPDEAFDRFGTHSIRGKITLAAFVKGAQHHLEGHVKFIHASAGDGQRDVVAICHLLLVTCPFVKDQASQRFLTSDQ